MLRQIGEEAYEARVEQCAECILNRLQFQTHQRVFQVSHAPAVELI